MRKRDAWGECWVVGGRFGRLGGVAVGGGGALGPEIEDDCGAELFFVDVAGGAAGVTDYGEVTKRCPLRIRPVTLMYPAARRPSPPGRRERCNPVGVSAGNYTGFSRLRLIVELLDGA